MKATTGVMGLPRLVILAGEGVERMAQPKNVGERDLIAAQFQRFGNRYRARLDACAALSPRIAQLSISFPVLFFALATRYGPIELRRRAIYRAVDGFALADIAEALGLPLCFRHIPPEACLDALPCVHWSAAANKQLDPHVPRQPHLAAPWLVAVSGAARTCNEAFACWLSRQTRLFEGRSPGMCTAALLPLALYAWHGQQPGLTPPLRTSPPWSGQAGLRTAISRSATWLKSVKMEAALGSRDPIDPWLPASTYRGHSFVPLTTACALSEEAAAMHNCIDTYAWSIATNECRLFSVRRQGKRVATLEVRPQKLFDSYAPVQLKGPCNGDCVLELWHAASKWIEKCGCKPSDRPSTACALTADDRLNKMLAPYYLAMSARGDDVPRITIASLTVGMRLLYRCVGLP